MDRRGTDRTLTLMDRALLDIRQADYEGDHRQRQEPAPLEGSPWHRPDLPIEVLALLRQAEELLVQARVLTRDSMRKEAV